VTDFDKGSLEAMMGHIGFDDYYIEATFQFKLLMRLTSHFSENQILPERNIAYYSLPKKNFIKKEIDIVIEANKAAPFAAIELKMPMNGQIPEQMFKCVEDIRFLEQLKQTKRFTRLYMLAVTNDAGFWDGVPRTKGTDIYAYFRANKVLTGCVKKPTGDESKKIAYTLEGSYNIHWKGLCGGFRYFILEV